MPVVRVSPGPAQNGTPSRRTACRKHEPMESFTESDPECYNGCNVHQRNGWLVSPTPRRQEEDTLCCNSSTTHDKLHVSGKKRDYRNSTARGLKTSSERMVIGSNRKNSLLKSSDAFQGERYEVSAIPHVFLRLCHSPPPLHLRAPHRYAPNREDLSWLPVDFLTDRDLCTARVYLPVSIAFFRYSRESSARQRTVALLL